jgi:hypothetical protein
MKRGDFRRGGNHDEEDSVSIGKGERTSNIDPIGQAGVPPLDQHHAQDKGGPGHADGIQEIHT